MISESVHPEVAHDEHEEALFADESELMDMPMKQHPSKFGGCSEFIVLFLILDPTTESEAVRRVASGLEVIGRIGEAHPEVAQMTRDVILGHLKISLVFLLLCRSRR